MKRTCIIVEDEPLLRKALQSLLAMNCPELEVLSLAASLEEARKAINRHKPDAIFLDLKLPDGFGLELVQELKLSQQEYCPAIVVTTAFEEYAVQAFALNVVAYLLKPVNPEDLSASVEEIQRYYHHVASEPALPDENQKVALFTAERVELVSISEIIRCQSHNNYTEIFLNGGKRVIISKSLSEVESGLQGHNFMRIHQSHLLNLTYLQSFEKLAGGHILLSDGTELAVSQKNKTKLLDYLRKRSF